MKQTSVAAASVCVVVVLLMPSSSRAGFQSRPIGVNTHSVYATRACYKYIAYTNSLVRSYWPARRAPPCVPAAPQTSQVGWSVSPVHRRCTGSQVRPLSDHLMSVPRPSTSAGICRRRSPTAAVANRSQSINRSINQSINQFL